MLQVAFGFEPFITGLLMIPTVLGSLASKPIIRKIIQRFGYRRVLLINTCWSVCVSPVLPYYGGNPNLAKSHSFLCVRDSEFAAICLNEYADFKRFKPAGCQQWQQFPVDDHDAVNEYRGGTGRYASEYV